MIVIPNQYNSDTQETPRGESDSTRSLWPRAAISINGDATKLPQGEGDSAYGLRPHAAVKTGFHYCGQSDLSGLVAVSAILDRR